MDAEMCPGKWTSWTGFRRNCRSSNSSASAAQPAAAPRREVSGGIDQRRIRPQCLDGVPDPGCCRLHGGPPPRYQAEPFPRTRVAGTFERIIGEDCHLRAGGQGALSGQRVFAEGLRVNGSGRCSAGIVSCPTGEAGQLGKER